jgi:hypothetical protein
MGPLGLAQSSGLPLGRVKVHPDDLHTMKIRTRDNWRAVKDVGWWIGQQENPVDLRQMQIKAIRFVMETKTMCDGLRRFYVEVEDGFLRLQGAPFLPVYMVPTDKEKWHELSNIFHKMLLSLRSLNWIDRFRRGLRKVDSSLVLEWNAVLQQSSSLELDIIVSSDAEDEGTGQTDELFNEDLQNSLHGRLFHLGNTKRGLGSASRAETTKGGDVGAFRAETTSSRAVGATNSAGAPGAVGATNSASAPSTAAASVTNGIAPDDEPGTEVTGTGDEEMDVGGEDGTEAGMGDVLFTYSFH